MQVEILNRMRFEEAREAIGEIVQIPRGARLRHGEKGVQRAWDRNISSVFEE